MLIFLTTAAAWFLQTWHGEHMMNDEGGWAGWLAMMIAMLLVVAAVGLLGLIGLRWSTSHGQHNTESALDIARERYARGELTDDEFQRIKKGLR
ncbi:MAG: SHOCT domain-containing protein [Dehalococcoidia bacterium]